MKSYTHKLIFKIACIVAFSLATGYLVLNGLYFTAIMSGVIILAISVSLYRDQLKTERMMERMISTIRYSDFNLTFPASRKSSLANSMNEALAAFRARLYDSVKEENEIEAWQKLIRVLTHEIMNSIAPIISLSETVTERATLNGMNEKDYGVMLQAMQTIHRRSKGLLDFVENYRKLTRIPVPSVQSVLVEELFNDMRKLFSIEKDDIVFRVTPPNLRIMADRGMIEQVMINLVKNAHEACLQSSSPEVLVEAFRTAQGIPAITVSDNGMGIVPEALDKVFVPFFTTKPGGSGIGLSICRQIMNRHGGSISVASEVEKGTCFTLRFTMNRLARY